MSRPVIVIRPEPGSAQTLAAARQMGLDAQGLALFDIAPVSWDMPEVGNFDGLLIGSANAFRHGGAGLEGLRTLPVHAVGKTTAAIARDSGFLVASTGQGGLAGLVESLSSPMRLLRLSGRERVDLSPPPGIEVAERIVYEARPVAMPPSFAAKLDGAVVLLHSAAAARHFSEQCESLGAPRSKIALALLGPRIADAAGSGWAEARIAAAPNDTALLELASEMCQKNGRTA